MWALTTMVKHTYICVYIHVYIYIHTHVFTSIYLCIYLQYFQLCSLRSDKPTLEHPCILKYTRTPLTKCRIFHCQSSKIQQGLKPYFPHWILLWIAVLSIEGIKNCFENSSSNQPREQNLQTMFHHCLMCLLKLKLISSNPPITLGPVIGTNCHFICLSIWHIIWPSICHVVWHILSHIIWHSI